MLCLSKNTPLCTQPHTHMYIYMYIHPIYMLTKVEQPLSGMELQENEAQKDYSIQEICLERTYS